jgi:hypothetical protein
MTPSGLRPTSLRIGLLALALAVASACSGDKLPGFANPPPVDAGTADSSDDDAGTGD